MKYNRAIVAMALAIVLVLSGTVLMEFDLEFTGALFLVLAILVVVYALFRTFFRRKPIEGSPPLGYPKEVKGATIVVALLSIIGAIEAASKHLILSVFFVELLLFALVFAYVNFRKRKIFLSDPPEEHKYRFPQWMYWFFYIGNGFVIIASEGHFAGKELFAVATMAYFFSLFFLALRWIFRQVKNILQLNTERSKTELLHLQSQVNPHFFFNMLNNLYGWVDKDPKKAQQLILQLSDLMRYSIYDGQKETVSLAGEVQYLKNYVELHKSRYRKEIRVDFSVQLPDTSLQIKPLLFIILLENAFKHGVENLREGAFVNISLSAEGPTIRFEVENNFDPAQDVSPSGIGLQNLKRRLELVYPDQHRLSLSKQDDRYQAHLLINLPA